MHVTTFNTGAGQLSGGDLRFRSALCGDHHPVCDRHRDVLPVLFAVKAEKNGVREERGANLLREGRR